MAEAVPWDGWLYGTMVIEYVTSGLRWNEQTQGSGESHIDSEADCDLPSPGIY